VYNVYKMITKNITIKEYQEKYIQNSSLNLSRFVQKKLDELIKR